jgi:hypothetical protein
MKIKLTQQQIALLQSIAIQAVQIQNSGEIDTESLPFDASNSFDQTLRNIDDTLSTYLEI